MQLTRTPDGRQVAGDREGHADHAALGRRVAGLPDLAVERRDRGDGDDGAPLAVGQGLGLRHGGGGDADAVERADQVDVDDLLEDVEVVGRLVLAVLADGAGGPADAGAVTSARSGPISLAASTAAMTWSVFGDVGRDEQPADLLGERLALVGLAVEVGDHDLGAAAREGLGGGGAEARGAAGDDGRDPVEVHAPDCIDSPVKQANRCASQAPAGGCDEVPCPQGLPSRSRTSW